MSDPCDAPALFWSPSPPEVVGREGEIVRGSRPTEGIVVLRSCLGYLFDRKFRVITSQNRGLVIRCRYGEDETMGVEQSPGSAVDVARPTG